MKTLIFQLNFQLKYFNLNISTWNLLEPAIWSVRCFVGFFIIVISGTNVRSANLQFSEVFSVPGKFFSIRSHNSLIFKLISSWSQVEITLKFKLNNFYFRIYRLRWIEFHSRTELTMIFKLSFKLNDDENSSWIQVENYEFRADHGVSLFGSKFG